MNAPTAPAPAVTHAPELLARQWAELKAAEPALRIRDAAARLGVTEGQLLATGILDGSVTRLAVADFGQLLHEVKALGTLMCLTRNAACVMEHTGTLDEIEIQQTPHGGIVTVIGPLELRAFLRHWAVAFAAVQPGQDGKTLRSVQVFDAAGEAVVKFYVKSDEGVARFDALRQRLAAPQQQASFEVQPVREAPTRPYAQLDAAALAADWAQLKDTHDFVMLLRRHQAARADALRAVEGQFTRPVAVAALEQMLTTVAAEPQLPIMAFVGNRGNIQIHQAEVRHIKTMGPWLNVLDPGFNLHLNLPLVQRVWAVRKPTADGDVHSLEAFDAQGELIVQFFGLRKPGVPERADWRALVEALPTAS